MYRARDTQLGRDVALKVLPEGVTADRERVARLEREAKLLAQLNHPNIAQVYGFVADGETRAIVMELVEGPTLAERVSAHAGRLDGVVHGIAFAPQSALGGNFLNTPWADVATAVQVSAYSLKALAMAALPLMGGGGAIVGLDFDASVAWPAYDWMGVAKAGLESCARYLARDLGPRGIRVNLVAAGPLRTMAAKSIPGFADFEGLWPKRAPLGWDIGDPEPAARACVALLSDWFPATTGEIVHADGGAHAVGG